MPFDIRLHSWGVHTVWCMGGIWEIYTQHSKLIDTFTYAAKLELFSFWRKLKITKAVKKIWRMNNCVPHFLLFTRRQPVALKKISRWHFSFISLPVRSASAPIWSNLRQFGLIYTQLDLIYRSNFSLIYDLSDRIVDPFMPIYLVKQTTDSFSLEPKM